jgi:hypothetical protein
MTAVYKIKADASREFRTNVAGEEKDGGNPKSH